MPQPVQRQLLGAIDQFVPQEMRGRQKQFYSYQAVFNTIAAGATTPVTTSIDNDSDFLVMGINRVVTDTTQLVELAFAPFLIQLQYTGAGSTFFQTPDHIENVAGTAQLPGQLFYPFLVPGGATLVTTLQNLDGVNARIVRLSFPGVKFFR
jgi:hypothetical protein